MAFDFDPWLKEAEALHRELPVFMAYIEHYGGVFKPDGEPQCDVAKLDAAGVRTFGCAVGSGLVGLEIAPGETGRAVSDETVRERAIFVIDRLLQNAKECPRAKQVLRAPDLRPRPGDDSIRFFVLLTGQQQYSDLESVDFFFEKGVRAAHISGGTFTTGVFQKVFDGKPCPALSEFGRQVVARMNELGIALDMAHMSDESVLEIARATKKPIMDGHTCSRDWLPHSRGLSDRALRAVAGTGGVVGIHFADHLFSKGYYEKRPARRSRPDDGGIYAYHRAVLHEAHDHDSVKRLRDDRARRDAFLREHRFAVPPPPPPPDKARVATLSEMADHIEYLVNVVGIDHVGLGGDVNGITMQSWPLGMDHLGQLPHLTAELLRRKWKPEDLRKFLSENWFRLFSETLPQ